MTEAVEQAVEIINSRDVLSVDAAIILGAGLYNAFLAITRLPQEAADWVAHSGLSPLLVLSVILLVYLVGFGIPALALEGVPTDPIILAGVALSLAYSSYVAEVYRAGIASVHPSQTDAGLATGLTRIQTLRFVVIPQAVRRVRPPLLNDFISLQKDVALVSILGISEAFRIAQVEAASTFNYTPLIAAALLYLAVTFPMARILDHITAKEQINS